MTEKAEQVSCILSIKGLKVFKKKQQKKAEKVSSISFMNGLKVSTKKQRKKVEKGRTGK